MQQLLVWRQNKVVVNCTLDTLHKALQEQDALTWLDLHISDLAEFQTTLHDEFHVSRLTLDSMKEQQERSRLIEQNGYFYVVVHGLVFNSETEEALTPKIDIVFGYNYLVTIHQEPLPWLDKLIQTAENEKEEVAEQLMSRGTARLLHAVLDALVDSYFPVLEELDDIIDELEDETIRNASKELQLRLFSLKKSLAQMRRVISPQIEVLNALITRTGDFIPTEAEPYFADVHSHLVRTFEVLDSYRDLMSGLLDVYLSTVSNRMNEVMKQLTLISTIFLPITFITGIFGQNFGHSPQVDHDGGFNFWIVLALMAIITIIQLTYFRHRKWI